MLFRSPSEPLSRASSLYDEDSLANEAEPTASLPKLGLDAKGLRASTAVGIVTDYLVSLGIPREELDHIDTLVNFDFERSLHGAEFGHFHLHKAIHFLRVR